MQMQGVKYQPKTAKKTFLILKPKAELLKRERDNQDFLISEWFIKL